jgi:hypothetical protein
VPSNPNPNAAPMDPLARRRAAAEERVAAALDRIQEASWYAVSARSSELRSTGRLMLDHEPSAPNDVLGQSLKGALPLDERR